MRWSRRWLLNTTVTPPALPRSPCAQPADRPNTAVARRDQLGYAPQYNAAAGIRSCWLRSYGAARDRTAGAARGVAPLRSPKCSSLKCTVDALHLSGDGSSDVARYPARAVPGASTMHRPIAAAVLQQRGYAPQYGQQVMRHGRISRALFTYQD